MCNARQCKTQYTLEEARQRQTPCPSIVLDKILFLIAFVILFYLFLFFGNLTKYYKISKQKHIRKIYAVRV